MTTRSDANFYPPLTHTLALTNGAGSPTLTRATAWWVFDNEDKLINVPASAAAFGGARMVRNMLASPDVLATQGVTTEAKTYTISFYGTGSVAFAGTYAGASLAGTGVSDRVQRTFTATAGTLTITVTGSVTNAQLENVTGQTDQTASEYVSGDQGAGVTNLQYFTTNKDGTPIPPSSLLGLATNHAAITNTMLYCRDFLAGGKVGGWLTSASGADKVSNPDFSIGTGGWAGQNATLSIDAGVLKFTSVANGFFSAYIPVTVEIGKTYKCSYARTAADIGVRNGFIFVGTTPGGGQIVQVNLGYTPAAVTGSRIFVATTTTVYLSANGDTSTTAGMSQTLGLMSIKESDVQIALTGTGLDNAANSCSLLTATADNATILQTITAAAAAGCTGWRVTRAVGSGNIYITRDGGANWTDITSLINSDIPTLVGIENTSVLNPVVGFKWDTSGDAIIVDGGINHLGTKLHYLPILTTSAAITVGAQTLTYPTAGNISDTAGTILATVNQADWSDGGVVGSATRGLFSSTTNKGAQSKDGTNTANGPTGTPSGEERIGMRWSGSSMQQAFNDNEFGAPGSYDGNLNLSSISIMPGITGYIRDVAIFDSSLSDISIVESWELVVSGSLDVTESGLDTAALSGNVLVSGSMSATEASIDTLSASGELTLGFRIGSMSATEASIDTLSASGFVDFNAMVVPSATIKADYQQHVIRAYI